MKQRCYNEKARYFRNYGGRGITVCDEWKTSFEAFYRDMGDPPEGLTIERKNNNGPYCKDNCVWATRAEQAKNTRPQPASKYLTYAGLTLTISQWARRLGIQRTRLYWRINKSGWPIERILSGD